ncbi:hypothetical protein M885DRAFT_11040 [Pelagophyceae sp. CCMP2097]|nr:hypothetical protein M885DRAFT_11040 [Pelagophyceae sp. CCMP2097]
MSLEPAPGESEAQSAPALARAHLSRFGKVYAAPEEPLRFVSAPETVEKRLAANRKVLDRVEALEGEPHTTTPLTPLDGDGLGDSYAPHRALLEAACRMVSTDTFFVDEMGCAAVSPDEIAHLLISVSRLVLRAYGGAETSNLLHFCRAAGLVWFKDARRQPDARLCLPIEWRGLDDCRVGAAFAVALEARLERLGFGSFAFAPSVNDVCLDDSDRNEKFDEFGPLPFMRERIVRVVLGVVCDGAAFFDDAQAMAESPALLASLERQLNDAPPSKWTSRYGHVVRVPTALCTQGGAEAERLAVRPGVASRTPSHFRNLGAVPATTTKAGDHVHKGPARPQDAGPAADGRAFHDGDVVGRRHHGAGVLYGTIVAFENQVGVPRYLISWSEGQDSWLAETQVRQLFVESSIESEVDNWPAQLIDPLVEIRTLKRQNGGGARFDGVSAKALQLWCRCAREGYTAWARERVVTRHVLLEDSCLRLAAPFLARPLTLAPNADCVAWQDTDETDGGAPTIIEGTTKEVLGTSPTRDEGTSLRPRDNAVALARAVVAAQRCAAAETLRRREALDDGLRDDKGHYRLSVNIEGLLDLSPRPRSTPPADASKRQRAAGDADDEWRRPEIQVEPAGRRDRSEPREAAAAVGGCLNRGGADAGDGCAAAVKRQKASELPATQPPTQKPEGPCSIYTMGLYM